MPTYQYRCAKCAEQFELWQSIHDDALRKHPGCGGKVTKVLSPAGIVLKGPGFYRTDNRSSSGGRGRDTEKAETAEKAKKAEKADSKSGSPSSNGSASSDSSGGTTAEKSSSSSKKDSSAT